MYRKKSIIIQLFCLCRFISALVSRKKYFVTYWQFVPQCVMSKSLSLLRPFLPMVIRLTVCLVFCIGFVNSIWDLYMVVPTSHVHSYSAISNLVNVCQFQPFFTAEFSELLQKQKLCQFFGPPCIEFVDSAKEVMFFRFNSSSSGRIAWIVIDEFSAILERHKTRNEAVRFRAIWELFDI